MIEKFIGIVKQQLEYWKYQVAHFGPDHPRYRPTKIAKYDYLIRDFTELLDYLERQAAHDAVDNPPPAQSVGRGYQGSIFSRPKRRVEESLASLPAQPEVTALPDNLADLPADLLKELSESVKGETDPLIKIINGRGGTATLDEILIDLYRKYKEVGKRVIVSNKLYRLSRRGLCWPLPGKKGIYTTIKPTGGEPDTDTSENDDGPDAGTSEPSPKPDALAKSMPSASSKARRDLFASTAIPANRGPY